MTIFDIAELAFQRFRTRSLRFFLTVLGVSVGIAAVFFLVSLGFGLQAIVIGKIVTSESLVSLDVVAAEEAKDVLPITDEQTAAFRNIEFVQDVSPLLSVPTEIEYEDLKAQTLTQAVHPSYFRYAGLETLAGEFYEEDDLDEIVVASTVLRLFEIPQDQALGKEVRLTFFFPRETGVTLRQQAVAESPNDKAQNPNEIPNPEISPSPTPTPVPLAFEAPIEGEASPVNVVIVPVAFKIVGIVETETNSVFVPLKALASLENVTYAQAKVRVGNIDQIEPVRARLSELGYTVRALTDTLAQLNQIFRFTQATLGTLGVIALFIASVGMFNTMTISLLERTREVGTLKTIGATHRDVWMIFLFEALLIGAFGGFGGLAIGFGLTRLVNVSVNVLAKRLGGESVELFSSPLWFVLSILSVAFTVGIVTGFYPARRAARLDALQALKRE